MKIFLMIISRNSIHFIEFYRNFIFEGILWILYICLLLLGLIIISLLVLVIEFSLLYNIFVLLSLVTLITMEVCNFLYLGLMLNLITCIFFLTVITLLNSSSHFEPYLEGWGQLRCMKRETLSLIWSIWDQSTTSQV